MPTQNELSLRHCNQYNADSACVSCEGIVRHEPWCATQSANVHYAFQAVLDSNKLTLGDKLILHALGAAWMEERIQSEQGLFT
jgi:hypothetical protein